MPGCGGELQHRWNRRRELDMCLDVWTQHFRLRCYFFMVWRTPARLGLEQHASATRGGAPRSWHRPHAHVAMQLA
jgi:hypothetical protein